MPQLSQERINYLNQQMTNFYTNVRFLQTSLVIANMNGELTPGFKKELRSQMLQIAAILEDTDV